MHRAIAISLLLFFLTSGLLAQVNSGEFLGTVHDPSGASVPNAKVVVRNLETNATKDTLTNSEGAFHIPLLPAGSYEVTVERDGFAHYKQGPLTLRLNQQA
jgi:hypothetical protein